MKLTEHEKKICKEYSKKNEYGFVSCWCCPLVIDELDCICYANIDGRTQLAKKQKRYKGGVE